jgi:uncharacterized protein (DUF2147 family)
VAQWKRVGFLALVMVVVLSLGSTAVADDPVFEKDAVLGLWKTEPNDNGDYSHVEIYLADGKYKGRIVYLNSPVVLEGDEDGTVGQPRADFKNPDEALRGRPLLGMDLMYGFKHNGKNKWEDGRIYDPESGKEYNCKVTMKDADNLEIFGYIKVAFAKLGRDTAWKRVVGGTE